MNNQELESVVYVQFVWWLVSYQSMPPTPHMADVVTGGGATHRSGTTGRAHLALSWCSPHGAQRR